MHFNLKKVVKIQLMFFSFIVITFMFCSLKERSNPLDPQYEGTQEDALPILIAKGWKLFEERDYVDAKIVFIIAGNKFQKTIETSLGLSWCHTLLSELDSAKIQYEWIVNQDAEQTDALAGLAIIQRDLPDYLQAIANAEKVLKRDPNYTFSHNNNINYVDLRLIIAECCVRLGTQYFSLAQEQIDILNPTNGLDINNPSSWIIQGINYDSYVAALIAFIEHFQINNA